MFINVLTIFLVCILGLLIGVLIGSYKIEFNFTSTDILPSFAKVFLLLLVVVCVFTVLLIVSTKGGNGNVFDFFLWSVGFSLLGSIFFVIYKIMPIKLVDNKKYFQFFRMRAYAGHIALTIISGFIVCMYLLYFIVRML